LDDLSDAGLDPGHIEGRVAAAGDSYQWAALPARNSEASGRLSVADLVQKCPPSVAETPYSEMDNTIYSMPFDFANYG
jgi:hypothetical protein